MFDNEHNSDHSHSADLTRRTFLKLVAVGAALPAIESILSRLTSCAATAQSGFLLPRDRRTRIVGSLPDERIGELMRVDARGGQVIQLPDFDLSKPGAKWYCKDMEMVYEPIPGTSYGCYRLNSIKPTTGSERNQTALSQGTFTPKLNWMYVVSVLIKCDFVRTPQEQTEINIGENTPDTDLPKENPKQHYEAAHWNGIPNQTNGWIRWEWELPSVTYGKAMRFYMLVFQFLAQRQFRIADAKFIELPPKPLVPYAKGEGVTFRGGPGNLPMRVFPAKQNNSMLEVRTTGARYVFNLAKDTIAAEQLLEKHRLIAVFSSSLPLKDLRVLKQSPTVCVLANDAATFGVQCDGMMMIAPHQEVSLTCNSKIPGAWNRLFSGHLVALDDWGGFTVNPDIPVGSGRLARANPLTPGLDFVNVANDVNFVSQAKPGWQVRWTVSPGERIAISVFPPRPYPWKESFEFRPFITFYEAEPTDYAKWQRGLFTVALPWGWNIQGYGMSFGPHYIPTDDAKVRAHIAALKAAGIKVCNYTSCHFYWSRDAQEYIDEVKRWKDEYGLDGIYTDGNPSQEWVLAYEEMRMVRELFPNGPVVLHSTGQMDGGGAPLALPDLFQPFVDTYCTATIRGEYVLNTNKDAPYHRYVTSQYRKANCIGIQKGDRWQGVSPEEQDKIMLLYNGRTWKSPFYPKSDYSYYRDIYYPWLAELRGLWEAKGSEPDFFEKYYLPKVRQLIGNLLGKYGNHGYIKKSILYSNYERCCDN